MKFTTFFLRSLKGGPIGKLSDIESEGLNTGEGLNGGINEGINEGSNRLINYIAKQPGKRLPEIEKELEVPAKTLERWIKIAREQKRIEFKGSKKAGGYYICKNQ